MTLFNKIVARSNGLLLGAFVGVTLAFVVKLAFDPSWVNVVLTAMVIAANVLVIRSILLSTRAALRDLVPCPDHLRVSATDRGFAHFPPLAGAYREEHSVSVYEASNAEHAGIWLNVARPDNMGATMNLTATTAWRLAEQLAVLVANHYQGDQRPDANETILSVDLSRLDTREVA